MPQRYREESANYDTLGLPPNLDMPKNYIGRMLPRLVRRKIRLAAEACRWPFLRDRVEPNFIVIGVMKGGTSSLYHYLIQHPQIVPPCRKELNFFILNYDLGYPTYSKYFPRCSELNGKAKKVTFEASPSYIFHPLAAQRCHRHLPNLKLILLLRDPIDRAYSHFKQGQRFGWEPSSFSDAIRLEPKRLAGERKKILADGSYYSFRYFHYSYATRGLYIDQIEQWLRYYRRDQLFIVNSERFFSDTHKQFAKLLEFLELDHWVPNGFPNMFAGKNGTIDKFTMTNLSQQFREPNERLYNFMGESYDWR